MMPSGGYLASFTTATPLLKDHPAAYFTANSMLLANIWEASLSPSRDI
jgi:hypothetical protein